MLHKTIGKFKHKRLKLCYTDNVYKTIGYYNLFHQLPYTRQLYAAALDIIWIFKPGKLNTITTSIHIHIFIHREYEELARPPMVEVYTREGKKGNTT